MVFHSEMGLSQSDMQHALPASFFHRVPDHHVISIANSKANQLIVRKQKWFELAPEIRKGAKIFVLNEGHLPLLDALGLVEPEDLFATIDKTHAKDIFGVYEIHDIYHRATVIGAKDVLYDGMRQQLQQIMPESLAYLFKSQVNRIPHRLSQDVRRTPEGQFHRIQEDKTYMLATIARQLEAVNALIALEQAETVPLAAGSDAKSFFDELVAAAELLREQMGKVFGHSSLEVND